MKRSVRALSVILLVALASTLFACFGDGTAFSGQKNGEDSQKAASIKPSFEVAMTNYADAKVKKSDLSTVFSLSLYQKDQDEELGAIVARGTVDLSHVQLYDKLYAFGRASMSPDSDDRVEAAYRSVRHLEDPDYNVDEDEVDRFLSGKTYYTVGLGHADDVYNLKAGYHRSSDNSVIKSIWAATRAQVLPDLFLRGLDVDLTANYLVTNFLSDLGSADNWSKRDAADKFFDVKKNRYLYSFVIDEEKVHRIVFEYLGKLVSSIENVDLVADYAAAYPEVLPYLKSWIKISLGNVNADVNYDKYPIKVATSIKIDVNAPHEELETALSYVIKDRKSLSKVYGVLDLAILTLKTCGTKGQDNVLGLSLELNMTESISYNKKTVTLKNADSDLFLPIEEDVEGRTVYSPDELLNGDEE